MTFRHSYMTPSCFLGIHSYNPLVGFSRSTPIRNMLDCFISICCQYVFILWPKITQVGSSKCALAIFGFNQVVWPISSTMNPELLSYVRMESQ